MRDINRIQKFCNELAILWRQYPDWRFGQLIENFKKMSREPDLFYIEDDDLLKMLKVIFQQEVENG